MTEYLLALLYFLLLLYAFKKLDFFKNIPGLSYRWIVLFFALKVFCGVILSLIYKHYYDPDIADIYKYYNDGLYLYSILWKDPVSFLRILTGIGISQEHIDLYLSNMPYWFRPWESPLYNDNRVLIRFNALVCFFSFGHFNVHTVFANLLSFCGLVGLYKFFLKYILKHKTSLLKWGIFLFPSLLFWGSGVLKEAVLIGCFGVGLYAADTILMARQFDWKKVLILLACLWIMFLLKPYILVLFIPCIIGFYISRNMSFLKVQITYILLFAGLFLIIFIVHHFLPEYSPIFLIARKQHDLINLSLDVDAGSLLHTNYLKPDFLNIISRAPGGFITTLTRPHILEADTLFILFAAIENLLIILLILTTALMHNKISNLPPATFLSFWFCIAGFTFIGITTPVAGALVRYKIIFLPFLYVFILNLANDKLLKLNLS